MRQARHILFLVFSLSITLSIPAVAQYHFTYNDTAKEIYKDIIDLKLSSADYKLQQAIADEPENLSYLHLSSYRDFFLLFITEDERLLKDAQKRHEKYRKQLEKHLDDNDPYKRFAIAEILLHTGIIHSKFDQMFRSARKVLSAYELLKENDILFPEFIYNKKSLSVIHSLAETVSMPPLVKRIFGIEGSLLQGLTEIEEVVMQSQQDSSFLFKEEIDAIYLYIQMYQANQPSAALAYLSEARLDPATSPLSCFLVAKMQQRGGLNDEAISTLSNRPYDKAHEPFHYLDLMEGTCRLRCLDTTGIRHISSYVEKFEGRHFIKEAYQKLAWASLVFDGDILAYKYYISQAKEKGHALVDDDKQAMSESEKASIPDPILLKARLLSDGGYHEKAYTLLAQKAYLFTDGNLKSLEFNYRMGRISDALKNYPDALDYYTTTIEQGKDLPPYFACNAALKAGLILESLNRKDRAAAYFQQCLSMNPEEYKSSLHQKAKTAMMRLEGL